MPHIAKQRIKKGGKHYAAGEPIELTEEELAELPEGAVAEEAPKAADGEETSSPAAPEDRAAMIAAAVAELDASAFKKDGGIRADVLRDLIAVLGFDVTAEEVAQARAAAISG
ncbi:hypothetical protein ACUXV3_12305 [Roseobacteraceae bacterium NS-SX3]